MLQSNDNLSDFPILTKSNCKPGIIQDQNLILEDKFNIETCIGDIEKGNSFSTQENHSSVQKIDIQYKNNCMTKIRLTYYTGKEFSVGMTADEETYDSFEFKRGEFIKEDITICKQNIKSKKTKGNFISCLQFNTSMGRKFTSGLAGTNVSKLHLESKDTFLAGIQGTFDSSQIYSLGFIAYKPILEMRVTKISQNQQENFMNKFPGQSVKTNVRHATLCNDTTTEFMHEQQLKRLSGFDIDLDIVSGFVSAKTPIPVSSNFPELKKGVTKGMQIWSFEKNYVLKSFIKKLKMDNVSQKINLAPRAYSKFSLFWKGGHINNLNVGVDLSLSFFDNTTAVIKFEAILNLNQMEQWNEINQQYNIPLQEDAKCQ